MPWVSYPFLKLSKTDISENVERDLISHAVLPGAAGCREDAARAQPLDFVQLESEFFENLIVMFAESRARFAWAATIRHPIPLGRSGLRARFRSVGAQDHAMGRCSEPNYTELNRDRMLGSGILERAVGVEVLPEIPSRHLQFRSESPSVGILRSTN